MLVNSNKEEEYIFRAFVRSYNMVTMDDVTDEHIGYFTSFDDAISVLTYGGFDFGYSTYQDEVDEKAGADKYGNHYLKSNNTKRVFVTVFEAYIETINVNMQKCTNKMDAFKDMVNQ